MKLLKYILLIALCICCMALLTGCTKNNSSTVEEKSVVDVENNNDEEPVADTTKMSDEELAKYLNITYQGGLYARDENCDLNIALFKSSDTSIAIITIGNNLYYGEYTTEEKTLEDGTKYEAITVEDKTFGYEFNDDYTGIVVDEDGKSYDAKKLDESAAMDMVRRTV